MTTTTLPIEETMSKNIKLTKEETELFSENEEILRLLYNDIQIEPIIKSIFNGELSILSLHYIYKSYNKTYMKELIQSLRKNIFNLKYTKYTSESFSKEENKFWNNILTYSLEFSSPKVKEEFVYLNDRFKDYCTDIIKVFSHLYEPKIDAIISKISKLKADDLRTIFEEIEYVNSNYLETILTMLHNSKRIYAYEGLVKNKRISMETLKKYIVKVRFSVFADNYNYNSLSNFWEDFEAIKCKEDFKELCLYRYKITGQKVSVNMFPSSLLGKNSEGGLPSLNDHSYWDSELLETMLVENTLEWELRKFNTIWREENYYGLTKETAKKLGWTREISFEDYEEYLKLKAERID